MTTPEPGTVNDPVAAENAARLHQQIRAANDMAAQWFPRSRPADPDHAAPANPDDPEDGHPS
jgi:hypothetical protein